MNRTLRFLFVLCVVVLPTPIRSADDDPDPTIGPKKLSEWLKILRDDDKWERRRISLNALEIAGPNIKDVVPAVRAALKEDSEERVRAAAATSLGHMGPKARDTRAVVDPLLEALKADKSGMVREASAAALGKIAGDSKETAVRLAPVVVPSLAAALKDGHERARIEAAESLLQFGPEALPALPNLIEAAKDKNAGRLTREFSIRVIGRISPSEARTALPMLTETLADKDAADELRKAAAETLGQLGKEAEPAIAPLGQALQDKQVNVRRAAAVALEAIGPQSVDVLPALEKAVKEDQDKFVRSQALHTIGSFGRAADKATPTMLESVKDPVIDIRLAAVEALGNVAAKDNEAVLAALRGVSEEGQATLREAANTAIKKIQERP